MNIRQNNEGEIAHRYRALEDGQVIDLHYVCNPQGHRTIESNTINQDIGYCIDCDEVLPVHKEEQS